MAHRNGGGCFVQRDGHEALTEIELQSNSFQLLNQIMTEIYSPPIKSQGLMKGSDK